MASLTAPVETRMKLSDTKQQFSKVINEVASGEARVVVEKSGLPVAAVISMDEYRQFLRSEEQRAEQWAALERISKAFADVPLEELEAEIDKAVQQARAEIRAERARRS
ncbi:MAG TPA: type II toxin-antitoxin system prevent-host-death family antitoxin [Thermomicrobiales bacterium]|nr:type II toxin-antitoxin system prevent-host-death family antitoxin [Thermomicrobiales bacterium]